MGKRIDEVNVSTLKRVHRAKLSNPPERAASYSHVWKTLFRIRLAARCTLQNIAWYPFSSVMPCEIRAM